MSIEETVESESLESQLKSMKIKNLKKILLDHKVSYDPTSIVEKTDLVKIIIDSKIDINKIEEEEKPRECECMFCKRTFVFKSEKEAMDHMEVCPGLAAQMGKETHTFDVNGGGGI